MSMKRIEKIGSVSIKRQERDGALYLSYWSSVSKKTMTRKVATKSINVARKDAAKLEREIRENKAPMVHERIRIPDAIEKAIKTSRSRDEQHRSNLQDFARYFLNWLAIAYPGLTWWEDVRYKHAEEYINFQRGRGLHPKTARNYASIIGITSTHFARIDKQVYQRIEISHPWFSETPRPQKRYLKVHDALAVLEIARTRESPNAVISIALGAFAGLNLWEIARMRVRDVDIENGLIEIKKSKNVHRERKIPVLPLVIDAIRWRVQDCAADAFLIKSPKTPTAYTISRNLDRRLFPFARKKLNADLDLSPKDLRKTLVNLLDSAGVDEQWQEAYIGHAAYSTIRKHYRDETVEKMQEYVLKPLQRYLLEEEDRPAPGKKRPLSVGELIERGEIVASHEDSVERKMEEEGRHLLN